MELKQVIKYSVYYILMIMASYYITLIGLPSLYHMSLLIVPFYNYLAIRFAIIRPSNKFPAMKKDSWKHIIVITTLFNLVFFWVVSIDYGLWGVLWIVVVHLLELSFCRREIF